MAFILYVPFNYKSFETATVMNYIIVKSYIVFNLSKKTLQVMQIPNIMNALAKSYTVFCFQHDLSHRVLKIREIYNELKKRVHFWFFFNQNIN